MAQGFTKKKIAEFAEDSVHSSGDKGVMSLTVRNDTLAALAGTDGDYSPLQVSATGALYVDGSDVTQPISAASLPLPSGASTLAKQDTIIGHVDGIEALLTTIDADTGAILGDTDIMSGWDNAASDGASVSGDVAHDAADAGEPVKIGGKARTANPTAVANNDRVDGFFDDLGKQVTVLGAPRDLVVVPTIVNISNTTETTVLAAGGAGVFHDVVGVIITNTSSSNTEVTFEDASAGTNRFKISAPANDTRGITFAYPVPQAVANNNWRATAADSVSSLDITVFAIKNV